MIPILHSSINFWCCLLSWQQLVQVLLCRTQLSSTHPSPTTKWVNITKINNRRSNFTQMNSFLVCQNHYFLTIDAYWNTGSVNRPTPIATCHDGILSQWRSCACAMISFIGASRCMRSKPWRNHFLRMKYTFSFISRFIWLLRQNLECFLG